jgi:hypothetical protein
VSVPLVIVEPLDGLISLAKALGVIRPYSFGDIVHVVLPEKEVAGQNVPTEHIHHLGLALGRRRTARRDLLKVEDNDARRPEIEPRRVVKGRIFADRIVDVALEHRRDALRRRLDSKLSEHVLHLFGAGRGDQILEHRHRVALGNLGQTEFLGLAERRNEVPPGRVRTRQRNTVFGY